MSLLFEFSKASFAPDAHVLFGRPHYALFQIISKSGWSASPLGIRIPPPRGSAMGMRPRFLYSNRVQLSLFFSQALESKSISVRPVSSQIGKPLFLWGQSLGGAMCLRLAIERPHAWDGKDS
jgi:hypothetical protein